MPTYDYHCGGCDTVVEIFHGINDKPKRKCPDCGALKLKRQIGAGAGIIFKGSGFYETDYRSKSYTEGAAKDTSKPEGSKSDSAKKSDKPKAKKSKKVE